MSSLKENLNSDYIKAANFYRSQTRLKSIAVYVENFEDISFWHNILSPYETQERIKFNIRSYTTEGFSDGKAGLKKLFGNTGDSLIICLDSDYDYLLEKKSDNTIHSNPYIFQTYSYSIENLKCYAENIHNLCVQATHNTDEIIDFSIFLQAYSKIIYELFIWNLYFYSINEESKFTLLNFCSIVKILKKPDISNQGKETLDCIDGKVQNELQQLQQSFPDIISRIAPFSESLKSSGLVESNTYLFMQGHALYDNVVLMLLKPVCDTLRQSHKEKISELSEQETEQKKKERKQAYSKLMHNIETLLSTNDKFKECFLFKKIEHDIEGYLNIRKSNNQPS